MEDAVQKLFVRPPDLQRPEVHVECKEPVQQGESVFVQKCLIIVAVSLSFCAAQTATSKPPEPETIGPFFYLATQTLKRLPSEDWKKHRGGAFSVTENVKVAGAESSFRIAVNDKAAFIFKASDVKAESAKLYQFTVKGNGREYELGKWKGRDYTPNKGIAANVARFGESSYALTPEVPLGPGEYALTTGDLIYTFGVK